MSLFVLFVFYFFLELFIYLFIYVLFLYVDSYVVISLLRHVFISFDI